MQKQQKELERLGSKIARRKKRLITTTINAAWCWETSLVTQQQNSTRVASPMGPPLSQATSWRRRRETVDFVSGIYGSSPGGTIALRTL